MKKEKLDRAHRFEINQLIDTSNNREEFISSEGLNISQTGILCEMEKEVELHSRIYILLQYPGSDESFEVEAIVVRIEKNKKHYLVAMKFAYEDPELHEHVKKFVRLLSK